MELEDYFEFLSAEDIPSLFTIKLRKITVAPGAIVFPFLVELTHYERISVIVRCREAIS